MYSYILHMASSCFSLWPSNHISVQCDLRPVTLSFKVNFHHSNFLASFLPGLWICFKNICLSVRRKSTSMNLHEAASSRDALFSNVERYPCLQSLKIKFLEGMKRLNPLGMGGNLYLHIWFESRWEVRKGKGSQLQMVLAVEEEEAAPPVDGEQWGRAWRMEVGVGKGA